MTIVGNYLKNACHEMGLAMMRTSYSPLFNEGLDFSCVVFDAKGQSLAVGEFDPAQMAAIVFTVDWCIEELGIEGVEEGDVIIHNDPYRGGCHIPEHMLLKPVFLDGQLTYFVANISHMAEIGGKVPGGFAADATDVYQEGLRLPPIKIMRREKQGDDVWKIIPGEPSYAEKHVGRPARDARLSQRRRGAARRAPRTLRPRRVRRDLRRPARLLRATHETGDRGHSGR